MQQLIQQALPKNLQSSTEYQALLETKADAFALLIKNCLEDNRKILNKEQAIDYLLVEPLPKVTAVVNLESSPSKKAPRNVRKQPNAVDQTESSGAHQSKESKGEGSLEPKPVSPIKSKPSPTKRGTQLTLQPTPMPHPTTDQNTPSHLHAKTIAASVTLAQKWSSTIDPTNLLMSEKLDGVRAYWSGFNFFSRQGNQFFSPSWFCSKLPPGIPLDGELWVGRCQFQKTVSFVRKKKPIDSEWRQVTFCVFDAPSVAGPYTYRLEWLQNNIEKITPEVAVVHGKRCEGLQHLTAELDRVVDALGGEGIMLRKPDAEYESNRSWSLLKVKKFCDEEARVLHWKSDRTVLCELPSGVTFGVSVPQTESLAEGDIITFKYQELTAANVPRFPSYLRIRKDCSWEEVCANAKTKQIPTEANRTQSISFGTTKDS